jgi:hypothetical protein
MPVPPDFFDDADPNVSVLRGSIRCKPIDAI